MNSHPHRPTNITTELAKERNREAVERTMASWIQKCLGIIGFGIGFDSIFTALHQAFPEKNFVFNLLLTHIIGLSAIAIGILLLVLVIIAYQTEIRILARKDYLNRPSHLINSGILVSSIILYGLVAFVAALFVLPK